MGVPESWEEGGQKWKKKSRNPWRLRILGRLERKQLEGEQMAERRDEGQEEVERKDRHSRRAEMQAEKGDVERSRETDQPNEVKTASVQVMVGTRSRRGAESVGWY